jgi:hypothetical protein
LSEIASVAHKLKTVRFAQQQFLIFWAMEEAVFRPGLDRMAADLDSMALLHGAFDASIPLDGLGPIADE